VGVVTRVRLDGRSMRPLHHAGPHSFAGMGLPAGQEVGYLKMGTSHGRCRSDGVAPGLPSEGEFVAETTAEHSCLYRLQPEFISWAGDMDKIEGWADRRQAQRFHIAVPVELSMGTGITRDLSVCGVFIETTQAVTLGEEVQLTLVLAYFSPAQPVRLHCRGRVVRIEPSHIGGGIAVAITAYQFASG
jgi:hypothetical protein